VTVDTDPLPWRPVFIVGPPRCGGTLLFESLALAAGAVTTGGESHQILESIATLHPADDGWSSNRLSAPAATVAARRTLALRWDRAARSRHASDSVPASDRIFLEKTPKNCLRVPFLAAAFPRARFVYLHRDPVATISSILEGWRSQEFVTYPRLPGWTSQYRWSFALVPGWHELAGRHLAETATRQWETCVRILMDDLRALEPQRWVVADFDRLVARPDQELTRLCGALEVDVRATLPRALPPSRSVLSAPREGKWRDNVAQLADHLHLTTATQHLEAETRALRAQVDRQ
jgi:hypothetical protein